VARPSPKERADRDGNHNGEGKAMLNGLDLFSGIGGIALALRPWVRTIAYVEIDRYAQAVLRTRISAGDLDDAPIWDDVTTFDPRPWAGAVDIISGGFPCQDISVAGRGAGLGGERSGLFFEIVRLARALRPRFIFLENVPALVGRGGWDVAGALTALGDDARWGVLSAHDVGAPHLRERWWCVAHRDRRGFEERAEFHGGSVPDSTDGYPRGQHADRRGHALAHADGLGRGEGRAGERTRTGPTEAERGSRTLPQPEGAGLPHGRQAGEPQDAREDFGRAAFAGLERRGGAWWAVEPDVGRMAHGISARVDRLRGLGNAVVPLAAREAFARLMGFEEAWTP
jgi:DNA (cytosine-5)-methyltransferase 1